MFRTLTDATHYVSQQLDSYFDERDYMSKDIIYTDMFDLMAEGVGELSLEEKYVTTLESMAQKHHEIDNFLAEHVEGYSDLIMRVVQDYLATYIDLEQSVIIEEK